MTTRRPLEQLLFALLTLLLLPAIAHAETDTAGTPDFEHIFLDDGAVIVTQPAGGQSPPTTQPAEFSSIQILRDGTVVTSSKTTATTQAPATSAQRTPVTKAPSRATPSGRANRAAATASASAADTNGTSAGAAPEASDAAAVIVASEQITNPALANDTLPETGVAVRPYIAIALLAILSGRILLARRSKPYRTSP